jgi:stage V sporulation protein G
MTIPIDEVKVKLANDEGKVLAYCTIVVCGIAIHEIKLIEADGRRFVSMPSRKLTGRCPSCGMKNSLTARHCNDCAARLPGVRGEDSVKLYADICHPISSDIREAIMAAVLKEYEAELRRAG